MKTLPELYEKEGRTLINRLHKETGINSKYLYLLATGRRRPSPEKALKLMDADSRLTLEGLLFGRNIARTINKAKHSA